MKERTVLFCSKSTEGVPQCSRGSLHFSGLGRKIRTVEVLPLEILRGRGRDIDTNRTPSVSKPELYPYKESWFVEMNLIRL